MKRNVEMYIYCMCFLKINVVLVRLQNKKEKPPPFRNFSPVITQRWDNLQILVNFAHSIKY